MRGKSRGEDIGGRVRIIERWVVGKEEMRLVGWGVLSLYLWGGIDLCSRGSGGFGILVMIW